MHDHNDNDTLSQQHSFNQSSTSSHIDSAHTNAESLEKNKDCTQAYQQGRLTILQLMFFLSVLGGLMTWTWQHFFV